MYLDEQLGGIEPLLLQCCGILSSQYRLHNVSDRIAGALHCVRMPCRRPWTPPLWELPHDRHVHIEVNNVTFGASEGVFALCLCQKSLRETHMLQSC